MTAETVVTLNDDFTDRLSDVPAVLKTVEPFAILLQEGKRTRYRDVLRRLRRRIRRTRSTADDDLGRYRQRQVQRTAGTRGLAIVWDADRAPVISGPHHQVLTDAKGAKMEPRGVTWIVVLHPDWGPVILATTHRPPWRYRRLWPEYDRNLEHWLDAQTHPVILGLDANTRRLNTLAARLGMKVAGKGIDAVMVRGFGIHSARSLLRRFSDHRPVRATVWRR